MTDIGGLGAADQKILRQYMDLTPDERRERNKNPPQVRNGEGVSRDLNRIDVGLLPVGWPRI